MKEISVLTNDTNFQRTQNVGTSSNNINFPYSPTLPYPWDPTPVQPTHPFELTPTTTMEIRTIRTVKNQKQLHEIFVILKKQTPAEKMAFDLEDSSISFVLNDNNFVFKFKEGKYTLKSGLLIIQNIADVDVDEKNRILNFRGENLEEKAKIKF